MGDAQHPPEIGHPHLEASTLSPPICARGPSGAPGPGSEVAGGGLRRSGGRRRSAHSPGSEASGSPGYRAQGGKRVQTSSSSMRAGSISRLLAWSNDTPCQDRTSKGMQVSYAQPRHRLARPHLEQEGEKRPHQAPTA